MIEKRIDVEMIETAHGAENIEDFEVREYRKGEVYNIGTSLAESFISQKKAKKTNKKPKGSEDKADRKSNAENK